MKVYKNYLIKCVNSQSEMHVYLISGIKLIGTIKDFDNTCVLFNNNQLINHSAIASINIG